MSAFNTDAVGRLLYWITEREGIRQKRERGEPPPWTADPILRAWSFCNVHREHDRGSRWLAANWRTPHADDPDLWFAMVVARFVNRPDTLAEIGWPLPWDGDRFRAVMAARKARGEACYGSAYMIHADKPGVDTADYQAAKLFAPLWAARARLRPKPGQCLAEYYGRLRPCHGMGGFMAAQIVADVKYVAPLADAPDWWTWAASGPGSRPGMLRLLGRPLPKNKWALWPAGDYDWLTKLRALQADLAPDLERAGIDRLCAQDLQNCLCEFDKHERARLGEGTLRRRYVYGGAAPPRKRKRNGAVTTAMTEFEVPAGAVPNGSVAAVTAEAEAAEPIPAAMRAVTETVEPEAVSAFGALAALPVWVAWREEIRGDQRRKVPYAPATGKEAKANDPNTWACRAAAEERAAVLVNGCLGGIGINLAEIGDGLALAGIDLDTCRDPQGAFTTWAAEVIRRFDSYTEISPSGNGAKVFFRLRLADHDRLLGEIREYDGDDREGKKWAAKGGEHPPAIELYLGRRYFTVTGMRVDGVPDELRVVDTDAVRWLIREAGPALATRDESRSAEAMRRALKGRRTGAIKTYDEMCAALRDATAEWYREKGVRAGGRELRRLWEKVERIVAGPPYRITLGAPYTTAQLFRELRYDTDDAPTLHHHRGGFYAWNGAAYPEVEAGDIRAQIYRFLAECVAPVKNKDTDEWVQVPVKPAAGMVNDVIDALKAAAILPATREAPAWIGEPGPDPQEIIACANGLLHLPTGRLAPHTPAFFTHNALGFAYDPAAPAPAAWLDFLRQLWADDAEAIATLQEMFGYCLTADTSQQKALMLVGPKRSGKGTIGRVLARLVGAENAVAPTLAGLGTNFGLAPLIGKRVAIISDARLGGRADQTAIAERLLSITGEDAITVDRKYREGWTGRLGVRFMVLTNELPRLADASGALASRFVVLLLTKSFYGREDPGLTNRLLTELPGVLNWAIEGWCRLRERGHFVQPASAREAIEELDNLGSPIGAFVRDRCVVGPGCSETVDRLFLAWEDWCMGQRRERAGDRQGFGRNLRAAVPGLRGGQRRVKEGMERYYEGIRLKTVGEAAGLTSDEEQNLADLLFPKRGA